MTTQLASCGRGAALAALVLLSSSPAIAQVATRKGLTIDGAKAIATAATNEARRLGAGGAIALVDESGHLLYLERLENTFPAASTVAFEKARTAATFRKPTRDFEQAIAKGRTSLVAVDVMTPLQGGVPIVIDGQVVGAIGVSGAMSAQQDDDIATVAANAASSAMPSSVPSSSMNTPAPATAAMPARQVSATGRDPVTFISGAQTMAAFKKGQPLTETTTYKVHASRRQTAGMAEVHARDTDVIYVLEGRATIVTGGAVVEGKTIATDEVRGARIDGGVTRTLAKGDVLIVPEGVPHWFSDVKGPLLYYVVKVTAPAGAPQSAVTAAAMTAIGGAR
jgi:glc operon protein GlcG